MPGTQSAHSARPRSVAAGEPQLLQLVDGTPVRMRTLGCSAARAVPEDEQAGFVAEEFDGATVGRASYERVYGPRAQVTLVVDPRFWHRGLPEMLLACLRLHAARVGITTFLMRLEASDLRLLSLLRCEFWARETIADAHVLVEFPTTPPT